MVIIKLMGGLGNQLQQYALYRKFISLGRDAYLDTSWYSADVQKKTSAPRPLELDLFEHVDYRTATREQTEALTGSASLAGRIMKKLGLGKAAYIREEEMYYPWLLERDDMYLEGYWGAEKYYADILPEIRRELAFDTAAMNNTSVRIAEDMEAKNASGIYTCSVHIRRGDYLDPENRRIFGDIATEAYYDAAFDLIRTFYPDAVFYIFSDDPEYSCERYGTDENCVTVSANHGSDSRYDIYLMSRCKGHICANSSFSFWGVRMDPGHNPASGRQTGLPDHVPDNGKICIRPSIHKNSQVFDPAVMRDLWAGWTFIDPSGEIMRC